MINFSDQILTGCSKNGQKIGKVSKIENQSSVIFLSNALPC